MPDTKPTDNTKEKHDPEQDAIAAKPDEDGRNPLVMPDIDDSSSEEEGEAIESHPLAEHMPNLTNDPSSTAALDAFYWEALFVNKDEWHTVGGDVLTTHTDPKTVKAQVPSLMKEFVTKMATVIANQNTVDTEVRVRCTLDARVLAAYVLADETVQKFFQKATPISWHLFKQQVLTLAAEYGDHLDRVTFMAQAPAAASRSSLFSKKFTHTLDTGEFSQNFQTQVKSIAQGLLSEPTHAANSKI